MKGLTREQRKQLRADVVEYRKQGHYASECATHFGVSIGYIHYACHGIDYPWKYDTETMSRAAKEQHKNARAEDGTAIKHLNKSAQWCEYVGGYTGWQCYLYVRCKTCGSVFNMSFTTLRQGKTQCPKCKQERKETALAYARSVAKERKAIEKIRAAVTKQETFAVCESCGGLFLTQRDGKTMCTPCKHKAKSARHSANRRALVLNSVKDSDITLDGLYKREDGRCYLCNGVCDWQDYTINNGSFIAGNNYPSIDHVVPLSKGGAHSWDNVRLAHRICNMKKSDKLIPLIEKK